MVRTKQRTSGAMVLRDEDTARLEWLAPYFDIAFARTSCGKYELRRLEDHIAGPAALSQDVAHVRLLIELCSRCAPWVYFHFGQSCKTTLLGQTDAKLLRIAQLYASKHDAGHMLSAVAICVERMH